MDFENLPDSSISLRNVTVSSDRWSPYFLLTWFRSFVKVLRQRASALRSLVVDANTPVWVHHATETVLGLAIDAFQIRSRVEDSRLWFCERLSR